MKIFNPQLTGRIAVAIAVTAVASIITLALLYAGLTIFGPINDLTTALGGLLSALLVWQFHTMFHEHTPRTATLSLMAAWVGSTAIIINSLQVAFGQMDWMTGGMYTAIGFGLQAIWLLAVNHQLGSLPFLTLGIVRLGTIAAVDMLFGLLAGPMLAAGVNFTQSPLVGIAFIGAGAGWLLYPVWCWRVGQRLSASPDEHHTLAA